MSNIPSLTFNVQSPILPGQPFVITWSLGGFFNFSTFNPGKLTAIILINGNQIYKSPTPVSYGPDLIQIIVGYYNGQPVYELLDLGSFGGETQTIQPLGSVANDVYKIGTNTLTLIVTGTGTDQGPWETTSTLTVTGENVDSSWWNWDGPPSALWGPNPYTVFGTFTNKSQWSNMTFNFNIVETEWDNSNQLTQGNGSPKVAPGNTIQEFSKNITQNWEFIIPGLWTIDGPFSKLFDYTVNFNLQDDFGNFYPRDSQSGAITSSILPVSVNVPDWKIGAATVAQTNVIAAAAMVVAGTIALASVFGAGAAPGFFDAAKLFYGIATTSGMTARDPPAPDPKFYESIRVMYRRIPKNLSDIPELRSLASCLTSMSKIIDQISVLDSIHGKLLGARNAKNEAGILLQTTVYLQTISQIGSDAVNLSKNSEAAQHELDRLANSRKRKDIILAWQKKGIPTKVRKNVKEAGFSKRDLVNLEQVIKKSDLVKIAASPTIILLVTTQILALTREIQKNAGKVIQS